MYQSNLDMNKNFQLQTTKRDKAQTVFIILRIRNYIYVKQWDVIIHPWHNFNGGLSIPRWSYNTDKNYPGKSIVVITYPWHGLS